MLTTIDNPYDPNINYAQWLLWDQQNQYYTQEYLATIANVSPDMDDSEQEQLINQAMTEIINNDTLKIYLII